MNQATCEFIKTARPIDKAVYAEEMVNSLHKVTRCDKCEKYHVWVSVNISEWSGPFTARKEARTAFHIPVGHNTYLPKGIKGKKKGVKVAEDDDN